MPQPYISLDDIAVEFQVFQCQVYQGRWFQEGEGIEVHISYAQQDEFNGLSLGVYDPLPETPKDMV